MTLFSRSRFLSRASIVGMMAVLLAQCSLFTTASSAANHFAANQLLVKKQIILGVSLGSVNHEIRITSVQKNTPAAKGGLVSGDIIVSVDGKKMPSLQAFRKFLSECKDQQKIKLTYKRKTGKNQVPAFVEKTTEITLKAVEFNINSGGIKGKKAPNWDLTQWSGLPAGKKTIDVGDYKGKVLYLYCFQSWCPGCHSMGFPTLKSVHAHYQKSKATDVNFAVVQTVFEGHAKNTFAKGKKVVNEKFKLDIPYGYDPSSKDKKTRSHIMSRYETRGTPWLIIIDKKGIVRANGFHMSSKQVIKLIDELRKEK